MKRIELRGMIVSSAYDGDWFTSYIQRGVITPESRIRAALAGAEGEDVELYINSQGGSVFAANEMANAIKDWHAKASTAGKSLTITVGALAASAAANLIALLPAGLVRAHKNSKIMYHSAYTITEGGEGAHADSKELLGKINADVKTALATRTKLGADKVAGWFAEGRAGWLTADEAKACGLVGEIIGEADKAPRATSKDIAALAGKGLSVAAMSAEDGRPFELASLADELSATAAERDSLSAQITPLLGLSAKLDESTAQVTALQSKLDAETAKSTDLATKLVAESKAVADTKLRADKAEATVAKLLDGSLTVSGLKPRPANYRAAIDTHVAAGMSEAAAVAKVRSEYPDLWDAAKLTGNFVKP